MSINRPSLHGSHLNWEVYKEDRTFRVYVVEPEIYRPEDHAALFYAALDALIEPKASRVDIYIDDLDQIKRPRPFDLVTFPEAFLPARVLLETLKTIKSWPQFGCIHVGLRPDEDRARHLFTFGEAGQMLEALLAISGVVATDFTEFSNWFKGQHHSSMFNLGCIFTVDAAGGVRVCLHPKMVRAKVESSSLSENNMTEASLLSLVTLRPGNKNLKTVVIQPLICSDALDLSTDSGEPGPLEAINRHGEALGDAPPDHIDVVSVATCTPQSPRSDDLGQFYEWHSHFRSSFERAAKNPNFPRHHFSTFVLSNFGLLSKTHVGGLSGVFMPVPLRPDKPPSFIKFSCWGKPHREGDNQWSSPRNDYSELKEWSCLGYLAYIDRPSNNHDAPSRIFGFTVHRFPRDVIPTTEMTALTNCSYWVAESATNGTPTAFKESRNA